MAKCPKFIGSDHLLSDRYRIEKQAEDAFQVKVRCFHCDEWLDYIGAPFECAEDALHIIYSGRVEAMDYVELSVG